MFAYKNTPQDMTTQVLSGFSFYRIGFAKVWWLSLVPAIFSSIISYFLTHDYTQSMLMLPIQVIGGLVPIAVSIYFIIAMYLRLQSLVADEVLSMADALALSKQKWLQLFLATLAYVVIISCGLLFVFIPGIYLMVALVLYLPIMLYEDKPIFDALKRSYRLTKDHWWRTLMVVFTPVSFLIVGNLVLSYIFSNQILAVRYAIDSILTFLLMPWVITTILVQYHDLSLRELLGNDQL